MALFSVNVVFFLVLMVIQVGVYAGEHNPEYFYTRVGQWFELPASVTKLGGRPWTVLSYMFTDSGMGFVTIMRLISNMIWLWAFGSLFRQMTGNDKLVPVYIYGGFLGAVFFVAAHYCLPQLFAGRETAGLLGANAAVVAIATAATTLEPGFRFFTQIRNGIPIWILTAIYILIDFAGIATSGAAYSLAHLGGALAGFLFIVFLRRGYDGSVWMNKFYHWFTTLFEPKKNPVRNLKDKVFYETGNRKPFTKTTGVTQTRIDDILDKINQKGYVSLTDEEKEFLNKASEEEDL